VDGSGNAYVTGSTTSTNFPNTNPIQGSNAGGFMGYDAFVTKITGIGISLKANPIRSTEIRHEPFA